LAIDPSHRRFRSADLRHPRLSGGEDRRSAARDERLHGLVETSAVKRPARPGFWLVATRELRFFRREAARWARLVAVPLIGFAVVAWTFSSAVVRGLNVVVVDQDRSVVSSKFVAEIAAAPGVGIAHRADTLTAATAAIRSGAATGAVYIPPDFEKD